MVLRCIYAAIAALFFAILYDAPGKTLAWSAGIAFCGFMVLLGIARGGVPGSFAYFAAALSITFLSELAARIQKIPATVYVLCAAVPLVPGYDLYRAMQSLVVKADYTQSAVLFTGTVLHIGAIAMGIALMSALFRVYSPRIQRVIKKPLI